MMVQSYPLYWPEGWKRTVGALRSNGRFNKERRSLTVSEGVMRVLKELERMYIERDDVIVSTNVPVRLDGLPRSDQSNPSDPGAAVYWRKNQSAPMKCMAVDRYIMVADNLAAVAATFEAMRAIERHGGAEILERTFRGFAALPSSTGETWWEVLQIRQDASREVIEASFKRLMKDRHPDAGGSHDAMAALNKAREQALAR